MSTDRQDQATKMFATLLACIDEARATHSQMANDPGIEGVQQIVAAMPARLQEPQYSTIPLSEVQTLLTLLWQSVSMPLEMNLYSGYDAKSALDEMIKMADMHGRQRGLFALPA